MCCAWSRKSARSPPAAPPARSPRCGTRRRAGSRRKGADKAFEDSLRRTRAAIKVDGEVADCDAALPARLLQHAWTAVQTAEGRSIPQGSRPAGAEAVGHPQGRFRALRSGAQRQAPARRRSAPASATRSTSTRCRACSPRRCRRTSFPRAGASASARCSTCLNAQQFFPAPRARRRRRPARKALLLPVRQLRRCARRVPRAHAQADRARQGHRHRRTRDRRTVQRIQARRLVRAVRRERPRPAGPGAVSRLSGLRQRRQAAGGRACPADGNSFLGLADQGAAADRRHPRRVRRTARAASPPACAAGRSPTWPSA